MAILSYHQDQNSREGSTIFDENPEDFHPSNLAKSSNELSSMGESILRDILVLHNERNTNKQQLFSSKIRASDGNRLIIELLPTIVKTIYSIEDSIMALSSHNESILKDIRESSNRPK